MRKGKTVIKRIEDKIRRQVTFAKRRKSLIKKAHELSVLCDVPLGLIIFSYSNKLYEFCSSSTSMENLIMRYQKEKEVGHTSADHSFHPADQCSNCAKTKESMMREIENLKRNLQLYDGHGLNLLTYDELLQFELHLESSLQHARARKGIMQCEFTQQHQQQTNKLKGKGKETFMDAETQHFPDPVQGGSSWEHLMWQAERQMMTCQRQDDDDGVTRLQEQVKEEFLFDCEEEKQQPTGALQLLQMPQPASSSQPPPNQGPYNY